MITVYIRQVFCLAPSELISRSGRHQPLLAQAKFQETAPLQAAGLEAQGGNLEVGDDGGRMIIGAALGIFLLPVE